MNKVERMYSDGLISAEEAARPWIILYVVDGCWVAEHINDVENLQELFGTTTLPTPFLAAMPESEVKARIRQLNPTYLVTVD